jgi:hypothetical protein
MKMLAQYRYKYDRWIESILWKLGAVRRKKILKFFGKWTIEDELYEILAEEITKEIDKEVLSKMKMELTRNATRDTFNLK